MRDGAGVWVIVDGDGRQPLRADDALERLYNLHLAAAAPALRDVLLRVLNRMQSLIEQISSQPHRDAKLVLRAHAVIAESRPPYREHLAVQDAARGGQRELDFEVA
jgi:hypothetical protein